MEEQQKDDLHIVDMSKSKIEETIKFEKRDWPLSGRAAVDYLRTGKVPKKET